MASVFTLGDQCDIDYPAEAHWVITEYWSGSYEGSGDAFYYDGKHIFYKSLGHCSCYGPGEDCSWEQLSSKEEFLNIYASVSIRRLIENSSFIFF